MIRRLATNASDINVQMLKSDRHGIVNEDIDGAHDRIIDFVQSHCDLQDTQTEAIPAE